MTKSFEKKVDSIINEMRNGIEDSDSDFHYQICEDAKTALLALVREEVEDLLPKNTSPSSYNSYDIGYYNAVQYIKQAIAEHFGGGNGN